MMLSQLGVCGLLLMLAACTKRDTDGAPPAAPPPASTRPAPPSKPPVPARSVAATEPVTEPPAPAGPASSSWPEFQDPAVDADFCTERVRVLDEGACFSLPEVRTSELLIYLHGIVPPTKTSVQKTNFENVVANAAERAKVAALIPRGEQGMAPKGYPGWWGWPTAPASYRQHGAQQIEKLRQKQKQLEALVGSKFERVYLAGSSSGAYFVVAIALHGGMPEVSGFGMVSGGSGYRTEGFAELPKRPVYIGFGKSDSVAPGARGLGRLLEKAGWPVQLAAHPLPHGAREVYLDEAFEFWRTAG
jgi:predicted esterase